MNVQDMCDGINREFRAMESAIKLITIWNNCKAQQTIFYGC